MVLINNNFIKSYLIFINFLLLSVLAFGQKNINEQYKRYLDSADYNISESAHIAKLFLDSIPEPIEKNIKGHLAEYYQLKGIINDRFDEQTLLYQNFMLALKYAKIEKKYDIAGMSSLELFYNTYIIKQDSAKAYPFLNEAKTYYTKTNNTNGLAEVMQMPAYVELYNHNYKKSNELILNNLDTYKSIKDDAYYYMYALFMLSSNYANLGDLNNAHKYFNILKGLKSNKTISPSLHSKHVVTLYGRIADLHFKNNTLDSLQVYLQKYSELRNAMNDNDTRHYFRLKIDYFDLINNVELRNAFKDSLRNFEDIQLSKTVDASIQLNSELLKTESQLEAEIKNKHFNRYLIAGLVMLLLALVFIVIMYYKNIRQAIKEFNKRDNEFSFLKRSHEKLKVKVRGLEDYISEVKKEVKSISSIDNASEQRVKIRELYKSIHHNSSTLLAKEENHLELINDLNVDFFAQITQKYPQLNHSEVIICYYLFTGFKNKEIAVFLNSTVRAVESKRYRINKKMNLQVESVTLLDFLNDAFKDFKKTEK